MFSVISTLYRLVAASGATYLFHWTVENIQPKTWFYNLRYLTMLNLIGQAVLFLFSVFTCSFRKYRFHGTLAALAMAVSLIVCGLFWGLVYTDSSLLIDKSRNTTIPQWWAHATVYRPYFDSSYVIMLICFFSKHSVPLAANMVDIIIYRPGKPYLSLVFMLGTLMGSGYIGYTEYLITKFKEFPYPLYESMNQDIRYKFYGASFGAFVLCCIVCSCICHLLSTDRSEKKKGSKTDKKSNNNNYIVNNSSNSHPVKNAASKKKSRKQE